MIKKAVVEDFKTPCSLSGVKDGLVEVDGEWVAPDQIKKAADTTSLKALASQITPSSN